MPGIWPVLRHAQRDAATAAFAHQRGAVLRGEAGIGKTRLAREVQTALDRGAGGPYSWSSVLTSATEVDLPLSPVSHLLPGIDISSRYSPRHLAQVAHVHLSAQAGGRPLAILVEDAHLLDRPSADVLAHLCRLENVPLLGTVRSGRTPPDSIMRLWREDLLRHIDVPPFSVDEVREAVWAALGGPVDSGLIRQLHQSSGGHPMYVRELVRTGVSEQTITQRHGIWIREGGSAPAKQLIDLIAAEMSRLTGPERDIVELIALAEPITVTLARPLLDGVTLDRLVGEGLVRVEDATIDGQFSRQTLRLSQPIYAECVRSMVAPERRRALYEAVRTDTPPAQHQTVKGFLRWTAWTLECGFDISFTDLMRAARAASSLGEFEFAIDAATAAFEQSTDTLSAVEALAVRARELQLRYRPEEALRDVEIALRLLRAAPTSLDESRADLISSIHELRADIEQFGLDDPERALSTVDRFYAPLVADGDRADQAQRYRISRAIRLGWAGQLEAPLAVIDEVDERGDVSQIVAPAILALTWAGRSTEARALASHHEPSGRPVDAASSRAHTTIRTATFFSHLISGRLDEARSAVPDLRSTGERTLGHSAVAYTCSARLLAAEGRWRESDEQFHIARQMFEAHDPFGLKVWSMAGEAFSAMQAGDDDRARELILRIDRTPWRVSRVFEADIRTRVAGTLLALKNPDAAGQVADLTLWARGNGFHLVELWSLDLTALADPQGSRTNATADRLRELSSLVDAPIGAPLTSHALAVIDEDLALADAAAAHLARLGYWVPRQAPLAQALSRREAEIAALAAAGLSSPAIAERLHLSPRTVEAHVSRIFAKLGVNRRSQLADALRRHPT